MPYEIDWPVPGAVLRLQLLNHITIQEFAQIDRIITEQLTTVNAGASVALMVDATKTISVPRAFQESKASQTYASNANSCLKYIFVVSNDKLMRLLLLLTFNLCKPTLQFFNDISQLTLFMSNRLRITL